ncbi:glutamyl-tRNA reductase [Corynebacterium phocae]|uniref:Glutamyl-tRNA reductase n=1 Tax=Corynebacterium phocae TaxID=161895 RepID=A0A1L7D179_9CORY|nr:glutamyl-tRNA reductase [Corynebacterium phocae]APT91823.1 glutamyl-tRNA reductase [Corynebacterium phocae]KAA8727940.1 glutamyl-tRNA reductase [Corynebacterium phocae]
MSVLVVGMSYQSAPVALLERLSMDSNVKDKTCGNLTAGRSLSEAMIVSTCNRMEVYAVTNSFHTGVQDVVKALHEVSGIPEEDLRSYLYVRYADAAAEHLMSVTSGLDSMVVGEQQIIGQVRAAYQSAAGQGTVGPRIHALAQAALHTGKRVHAETLIDEAGASMVSFAFDRALEDRGGQDPSGQDLSVQEPGGQVPDTQDLNGQDPGGRPLEGSWVLILGAGAMAALAATHAGRLGAKLIIANRTRERAERLADHACEAGVVSRVVDFAERTQVLPEVDVVVSATGAQDFTINAADIPAGRPLTLIDLSMPRDIDPAAGKLDRVNLVNIESLARSVNNGQMAGGPQGHARRIVMEELEIFTSAQRVRDVAPAVSALRKHAADLVACEAARLEQKHPELDAQQREDISRALKRVVDKLLHQPTVRAKQLAATEGSVSHETALQDLFGLDLEEKGLIADVEDLPKKV